MLISVFADVVKYGIVIFELGSLAFNEAA